jgi:FKBP-type peptidyl-prolyl cis-trans isomerase
MKLYLLTIAALLMGSVVLSAAEAEKPAEPAAPKTETNTTEPSMKDFSYSLGYTLYTGNKQYKLCLSPEKIMEGIDDGFAKNPSKIKTEELKAQHQAFMTHSATEGDKDFVDANGVLSYFTGYQIGMNFIANGVDSLDKEEVLKGINDAKDGKEPRLNEDQRKAAMDAMDNMVKEKAKAKAEAVKVESKKFLEENAKKEGVKVTESGLQYQVIKEGEGAKPKATDTVKVHYKGTLVNGKEFDSSYKRGEPISFPLNGVIKGWTEGLQLMPTGSTYRFFIPSELGYGDRGAGADIPGGAALIFDVELIEINPSK